MKLAEYLLSHPCIDCGATDVRVLEFDHVRSKKSVDISRLVTTVNNGLLFKMKLQNVK